MKPLPSPSVSVVPAKFEVRATFTAAPETRLKTTAGVCIWIDGRPFVKGRSCVPAEAAKSSPFCAAA